MNKSEGFKIEVGVATETAKRDFGDLTTGAQRITKTLSDGFKSTFSQFRSGFKGFSMPKSGGGLPIGSVVGKIAALSAIAATATAVIAGLGAAAVGATAAVYYFAKAFKDTQAFAPVAAEFYRLQTALEYFKNTFVSGLFDGLAKLKIFDFMADVVQKTTQEVSFFFGAISEAMEAFGSLSKLPDWVWTVTVFLTKAFATLTTFVLSLANTISQACKAIYHAVTFQWGKLWQDKNDWVNAQSKFANTIRDIWTNPDRFRTEMRDATGSMRYASRGTFSGVEAQNMGQDIQQQQFNELRNIRGILERIQQSPAAVLI